MCDLFGKVLCHQVAKFGYLCKNLLNCELLIAVELNKRINSYELRCIGDR
jgi:hypothetical protein